MFKPYGVIPALVTPLDENGNLKEEALRQVIEHTIKGGVHGVFILGSTGEIYALTLEQKRRAIEITMDQTAGRVPVYAGAGDITTRDCVKLAQVAESYGVDAISVLTPYFITPSPSELKEHYTKIAASTKLPLLLYTNPDRTGVGISADLCVELSKVENIVGIKDSSGDMTLMGEYIRRTADNDCFSVIAGRDTLILGNLCYGGAGAIAATANIVPDIVAGIYNSFTAGDLAGARDYQNRLAPLRIAFGLGSFPVVMKEALQMIGIDAGVCMAPVGAMTTQNREKLANVIKGLGIYHPIA